MDGGQVSAIYHREIDPNTEVFCHLSISESRYRDEWGPSFSIILSETGEVVGKSTTGAFVQLVLGIAENTGDRQYSINVQRGSDLREFDFLGLTGEVREFVLRLGWRDDGVFGYVASEDGSDFGQGYLLEPGIEPRYAVIVASGMAGQVKCGAE